MSSWYNREPGKGTAGIFRAEPEVLQRKSLKKELSEQ